MGITSISSYTTLSILCIVVALGLLFHHVTFAPDLVNAFINPGATDVRENIESVVQRNLKAVLGAQFTEKEGERDITTSILRKWIINMPTISIAYFASRNQDAVDLTNQCIAFKQRASNDFLFNKLGNRFCQR